ncbi:hypothetical protein TNCV_233131 [Trichonephila clavipes]|nr:hypothetical protein TNCV_233131 [Trichonephila clavipes]
MQAFVVVSEAPKSHEALPLICKLWNTAGFLMTLDSNNFGMQLPSLAWKDLGGYQEPEEKFSVPISERKSHEL